MQVQNFLGFLKPFIQGLCQFCPLAAKPVCAVKRFMLQVGSLFHEIVVVEWYQAKDNYAVWLHTTSVC